MGIPLRESARRARRLTRGWAAQEHFAQEGLLAERTIPIPPRPPATRDLEREGRYEQGDDMFPARGLLELDELARVRRRGERARAPERNAEECA